MMNSSNKLTKKQTMKLGRALFVISAGLVFPLVSSAFVPPSFFMIKKLSDKRTGYRTLKVTTLVKELKDKNPTGLQFKQVTFYDERSGSLKSWAIGDGDKPIFYQERRLGVSSGGSVTPAPLPDFLLFQAQVVPLARALIQTGVPVKTELELDEIPDAQERRNAEQTAVKRWNGGYAWVIGRDADKPQLWVEKDGFLPVRLLLPNTDPNRDVEIQFNSQRSVGGFLYPHEVVLLSRGNSVLKEEVVSVVPNPTGSISLPIPSATGLIDEATLDSRMKDLLALFYFHVR